MKPKPHAPHTEMTVVVPAYPPFTYQLQVRPVDLKRQDVQLLYETLFKPAIQSLQYHLQAYDAKESL